MLTEQEIMNDALMTEKQLISSYAVFLAETSCQNLRNELNKIITETGQVQFEIFNALKSRGWYNVKNAQINDVQVAYQKYTQVKNQL
ncbi:MAG: spore coat protein [Clostridiaceae bacterium]|nr:spore coat protein [Clostridiaceae bacterium]